MKHHEVLIDFDRRGMIRLIRSLIDRRSRQPRDERLTALKQSQAQE